MTSDDLLFDNVEPLTDHDDNTVGVSWLQTSDVRCPSNPLNKTHFEASVKCNSTITGQGAGKINSAKVVDNGCGLKVEVEHNAGCPVVDFSAVKGFIQACKWIIGITFIIVGPIIGMVGKRWFPWVVAIFAAFCSWALFCLLFLVFGWMGSSAGFWICSIVSICLSVLVAWLVKKAIWFEVGLLGVLGGFFLATWVYSLIVAASSWDSVAFYWCLTIPVMIVCGVLSWKYARMVVMVTTSGIGAYMFCRGLSYLFGGWPSDAAMFSSNVDYLEFGWSFWLYWCLTICLWIFFVWW